MVRRLGLLLVFAAGLASCFYDDKTLATGGAGASTTTGASTTSTTSSNGSGGAAPCSAAASYEACVLASEPELYFQFDDPIGQACDTIDPSRCLTTHESNTGTEALADGLVAGTAAPSEGKSRQLGAFYGYVNEGGDAISDALDFIGHDSAWTVELWYRRPVERSGWLVWLRGATGSAVDAPKLQVFPNGPEPEEFVISFHSEPGAPNWGIVHDFAPTQTLHVVMRYDGAELDLHENGVRIPGSAGGDNAGTYSTPPLFVLAGYGHSDDCDASGCWRFTGSIDETAIYPRALDDAEIQAHYLRGSGQAP